MIARIQFQPPQSLLGAMIVILIALVVVLWLYRGHVRTIRSRWGWALPTLRVLVLGALAVSLFRPEILTPVQSTERRTIAVLVDHSRSMSVIDATRSEPELVKLAAALGMFPAELRSGEMTELRSAILDLGPVVEEIDRSRSEQRYALLAGRGIEAAEAHVREAQRELRDRVGMLVARAPGPLGSMISLIDSEDATARIAQAVARIDQLQEQADADLYRNQVAVQQAALAVAGSTRLELLNRAIEGDEGLLARLAVQRPVEAFAMSAALTPWEPKGSEPETAWSRADFDAAVRALRTRVGDSRLAAIVVLSDGRRISTPLPEAVGPDVPVFAVAAAAPATRDLSIERVWVPQTVYVGQPIEIAVAVRAMGYDFPEVQVTIECAGTRQSERVTLDQESAIARLPLRIERPGPQRLTIDVTHLDGEATIENNHISRTLKVISQRTRVAILAGRQTEDFKYFGDSLKADSGIETTDRLISSSVPALSAEQILEQDVVVLSELPADAMDARQWDALHRLVEQRGGSVIIATTDPTIAAGYSANPLAAALLPWRREVLPAFRAWPGTDAIFRIVPVETGDGFTLWDPTDPAAPRWNDLPPVFRYLSLPALRTGARPILLERDSRQPVLVEGVVGAGRVLFIGLDELWRWRGALGDEAADRLWPRIVRHMARQPFAIQDGPLALDVDPLQAEVGEIVRVRAHAPIGSVVEAVRGTSAPIIRELSPAGPVDQLEAILTGLPAGEYRLRLFSSPQDPRLTLPLRVEEDTEQELRDVSLDMDELRRLAGARGQVLELADVPTIPRRLDRLKESDPVYVSTRLWDSPYLFVFLLACLGLEWAWRKQMGLA